MSQRFRRAQKKPPQNREPEKESKKTLQEHCRDLSTSLAEARRAKLAAEKRERYRVIEDEQMAMMYGPNWRNRVDLPDDEPQRKAS
jgi:hypothetical protein